MHGGQLGEVWTDFVHWPCARLAGARVDPRGYDPAKGTQNGDSARMRGGGTASPVPGGKFRILERHQWRGMVPAPELMQSKN